MKFFRPLKALHNFLALSLVVAGYRGVMLVRLAH